MLIPKSIGRTNPPLVSIKFWLILGLAALALSCAKPRPDKAAAPSPTPQAAIKIDPLGGYPPAVLGKPYPGRGVLKIINQKERWVEIEHGEIKDLMAPMTMEFWVRDPAIMKGVSVGDEVDFVVVEDSKGQYVTELKKVTPGG